MQKAISNIIHCFNNLYLLTFNLQPEGTYFESFSYPRSESIPAELNFDSILEAIKNEGFEPAGYNDVSTFISNSNACKDHVIIMLGETMQRAEKTGYRALTFDPSKDDKRCGRESFSTIYLDNHQRVAYLVKKK